MSESRSLTNFIGNGVAAIVVARWENELDMARLTAELNGGRTTPVQEATEGSRQLADL
jgi:aerobic C4-dicarboxylate transport protein